MEHIMISRDKTKRSTWTFSFLTEINEKEKGIMWGESKIVIFSTLGMLQTFTMKYCFMGEAQEWTKFREHNHCDQN